MRPEPHRGCELGLRRDDDLPARGSRPPLPTGTKSVADPRPPLSRLRGLPARASRRRKDVARSLPGEKDIHSDRRRNMRRIVNAVILGMLVGLDATQPLAASPQVTKPRGQNCLITLSASSKSVFCRGVLARLARKPAPALTATGCPTTSSGSPRTNRANPDRSLRHANWTGRHGARLRQERRR